MDLEPYFMYNSPFMVNRERITREQSTNKEILRPHYQVAIVGGGLSGITLARQLTQKNIDYLLVDAEKNFTQSVHYLTTKEAADSQGLEREYDNQTTSREPITGYARYDGSVPGLQAIEALDPDRNRPHGFVTLSKQEIKDRARLDGVPLVDGMSVARADMNPENGQWDLHFQNGASTAATILVDATGANAKVAKLTGILDEHIFDNRKVRYCYGAEAAYEGPENMLLFADKFPKQEGVEAREGAGWIMPLGNGKAEIVVGWEGSMKDGGAWYRGKPNLLLQQYVNWFNERGIRIDLSARTSVVSGIFAQEPLDYQKLQPDSNLLLFGESFGLNHPLNGYLISSIAESAHIAAEEIEKRLQGGHWDPYTAMLSRSKIFYGPQVALSRRKTQAAISGEGRASATAKLQEFLVKCLSPDGIWEAIDTGVPIKSLLAGLLANPKYAPLVLNIGFDYLSLLLSEELYQKELWLKLTKGLRREK